MSSEMVDTPVSPGPRAEKGLKDLVLNNMVSADKIYPQPLPRALADWYLYTADGGHSIGVVLPATQAQFPGEPLDDLLVPAPVKAVLRVGYRVDAQGYIWCELPYDATLGLVTEPDDDEY